MTVHLSSSEENLSDVTSDKINKYWKRKQELIEEIKKLVGKSSFGRHRLNILIIGAPGCGKSSFINSILTSFREDKWTLYARVGKTSGANSNITQSFKSYQSDKDYYKEEPDVLLPTFIDVNGIEDEVTPFLQDFLRALFAGKILEKERLTNLKEIYNDDSTTFNNFMQRRREYLRIDRIIVVASADPSTSTPAHLYRCIREAAFDSQEIPIFSVMTKKDKFKDNEEINSKIESFLGNLGITEDSFKLVSNYCPDVDPKLKYHTVVNPKIDVPILKFIAQVINPHFGPVQRAQLFDDEMKLLALIILLVSIFGCLLVGWVFVFSFFVCLGILPFFVEIPQMQKVKTILKHMIIRLTEGR